MKQIILLGITILLFLACSTTNREAKKAAIREFNGAYSGDALNRVAFPIGGIGAGMICLDGNGAFSHVSVRNKPDVTKTPFMFAAISVKGVENGARILEGPVQLWKFYGDPSTSSVIFGCPRFENASFTSRFPFGTVALTDPQLPLEVSITGWSPFIPTDADNSSLPAGALEYTFKNTSGKVLDAVFSFNAENFMRVTTPGGEWGDPVVGRDSIMELENGFILEQACFPDKPHYKGEFAIFTNEPGAVTDYCWFRGGWFDSKTILWRNIQQGEMPSNPVTGGATGASVYIPVKIPGKESKTIRIYLAWHVPHSDVKAGESPEDDKGLQKPVTAVCDTGSSCCSSGITSAYYEPWYSGKFKDVREVAAYWQSNYEDLKSKTGLFTRDFYDSDLPPEVLEAIAANLSILKSPTVLRQKDGKLWAWEGCHNQSGCCNGSCTHVWNYAQALPHLFPALERTLRETEFTENQNADGHQNFRANLPIRKNTNNWYAAADGQLGGILKVYRDWRISGDTEWLRKLWPSVHESMDFCIGQWDPRLTGTIEEPHHNTYDIEFWGPDALCTGFYLGALTAFISMSAEMGEDTARYAALLEKGRKAMESDLYNGTWFMQQVKWEGLNAQSPAELAEKSIGTVYSAEALAILKKEGPKYQYGNGCLSDGVLGLWMARVCGIGNDIVDPGKVNSHLLAVFSHNLKHDLSVHANPQRAIYAYGHEGGLLLCSWPGGGEPTFPFVYSNEVWTGIEYQVASHLMLTGHVKEGLDIVRTCRERYDGRKRNPFDEVECGHWYARAMSSYGLIQGLTGLRYDAVTKTLYSDSKIGNDYSCFISTATGFGTAGLRRGKPFIKVSYGHIDVESVNVSGRLMEPEIIEN